MKTYTGELKDGMPVINKDGKIIPYGESKDFDIDMVFWDNEWQLYKPQAKKVWGIPEVGKTYYLIKSSGVSGYEVIECTNTIQVKKPVYLSKEHAEQHAKALNMANDFRLLSDVPVDGVKQWCVNSYGAIDYIFDVNIKLYEAIFGVVFNTKERAQ